jgi:hypothetical protein
MCIHTESPNHLYIACYRLVGLQWGRNKSNIMAFMGILYLDKYNICIILPMSPLNGRGFRGPKELHISPGPLPFSGCGRLK